MYRTTEYKSTSLASHSCTVKTLLSFCLLFVITSQLMAQDSSRIAKTDSLINLNGLVEMGLHGEFRDPTASSYGYFTKEKTKRRVKIIAATNIIGYSGAMVGLY